jgi:hypothetical protein
MIQFYGSAEASDSVLILENTLAQGVGGGALAFTLVEAQAAYVYPQPTDASPQSAIRNPQFAIRNSQFQTSSPPAKTRLALR